MAIHEDSPVGTRLRAWILKRYGSLKKAADAWGIQAPTINPVLKGKAKLGSEWIARIEENGGDYHYILTGRKTDIHSLTRDEKAVTFSYNEGDKSIISTQYKEKVTFVELVKDAKQG